SVDGYITNLNLRLGSQAVANQPVAALVDVNSYWVHGYFRETRVGRIQAGDPAVITLMSYPDAPLTGVVDSIGWGIAQQDGSTGEDLLPSISPTFEWIRLAQRVPVRVHLEQVPDAVALRVGTTASVLVRTGGKGRDTGTPPVAAPAVLQEPCRVPKRVWREIDSASRHRGSRSSGGMRCALPPYGPEKSSVWLWDRPLAAMPRFSESPRRQAMSDAGVLRHRSPGGAAPAASPAQIPV
ncbi:MAG: HlyD family efflux transporter periplasmic adaptor subunit, partial [Thiohalocapsa sp.]